MRRVKLGQNSVSVGYVEGRTFLGRYGDLRVELVQPGTPETGNRWFGNLRLMSVLHEWCDSGLLSTYCYTTEKCEDDDDGRVQKLDCNCQLCMIIIR